MMLRPVLRQFSDDAEQVLDFCLAEGRRGLVQNDDFGLLDQGLGDLHRLLPAAAQVAHDVVRRDVGMQVLQHLPRLGNHLGPVDDDAVGDLFADKHVFNHVQQREKGMFLVNRLDANLHGGVGCEHHLLSVKVDFPFVGRVGAGQHFDQR